MIIAIIISVLVSTIISTIWVYFLDKSKQITDQDKKDI
jgi:uncharacterized membrane protein YwzB